MYLHLGQETVVRERDIIGIFDLDNTTVSRSRLAAGRAFCKGIVCTPARRGGRDIACNHLRWGKPYKRL